MMLSTSLRPLLRPAVANLCLKPARRLVGTTTFHRSHSWQGSVMRLGLAIGVVYHYSTSCVFAESPSPDYAPFDHDRSAVDELVTNRDEALAGTVISTSKQVEASKSQAKAESAITTDDRTVSDEKDASQQGAFNPDTGEFNWDCSCLGGMAHGPCGEEFKAAFSCFMLSTEEPRGMECIEKFQTMQTCFRKYPEVYGAELADEDSHSPSFDDEHAHINSHTTHSETDKTTSKLRPEP